jgi:hypothetical protein
MHSGRVPGTYEIWYAWRCKIQSENIKMKLEKKLPNLFIDGCDCTGKTSVIKELIKLEPQYRVRKCSARDTPEEARKEYEMGIIEANSTGGLIYDRFMWGEVVYSPLMRGYTPDYIHLYERKMQPHNILIFLTAEHDIIKHRFDGQFISANDIPFVDEAYHDQYVISQIQNKFIFDTSDITPERLAYKIKAEIIDKYRW